jgi:tetratricopeptide (TPR) repeat protein
MSLFGLLPDKKQQFGAKAQVNTFDDDSDALRLHDLDTINNSGNNSRTHFIASDASTVQLDSVLHCNQSKKNKRRLQWRVGPLVKKERDKTRKSRTNHEEASLAEKTIKSVHTLHSTETEVIKNNRNKGKLRGFYQHTSVHKNGNRNFPGTSIASYPRTPTTVSSDGDKDDADDGTDCDTVVMSYMDDEESGEHLPHKTIRLFLSDSETCLETKEPLVHTLTFEDTDIAGFKTKTGKGSRPPIFPASTAAKDEKLSLLPPPDIYNDHDSMSPGGRHWQLAKLQAISEGLSFSSMEENQSNRSIDVPKRSIFSFSKKSSNESVASAYSSQSQRDLQRNQAERNLKAMQRLVSQHLQFGEYEEAVEVLQEILRGVMEMYGESHYRVGTVLHNISTVHMRYKRYDKVVQVSRKAIRVRRATLGEMHPDVAVSYAQLGIAHMERREYKYALMAFNQALSIRRKTLNYRDSKIVRLLNNIGCCLFELGKLNEAKKSFEETLQIQRMNMKNETHNEQRTNVMSTPIHVNASNASHNILCIASTLCNLGSIKVREEEYDDAALYLEEALLLQQSVLGDDHVKVVHTRDCLNRVEERRSSIKVKTAPSNTGIFLHLQTLMLDLESIKNGALKGKLDTPSDFLSHMMNLNQSKLLNILEDISGNPVLCKTCTQETDEVILSSPSESDSLGGDLRWI